MKKLVLDTNTIISALFWQGHPRKILNLIKAGKYELLTSYEIEKELIRVLHYEKFGLNSKEILPIIIDYRGYSKRILISSQVSLIKDDPTDNIFLDCARDGHANFIISGDHHLLDLNSYESIPIVNSATFLKLELKWIEGELN